MKTVFIVYNQALTEKVEHILNKLNIRGYSRWPQVQGRGSEKGEPHLGTHTWPALNEAILTVVDDDKTGELMSHLKHLNDKAEMQGLRAFIWDAEVGI
ncbi:PG0541 family transporter-associated protein [Thermophagus sp. OGC60D27]|uniref:PG0541 family transporter-associated protein n=1 Tax=Thermophagus sp. OGC60D27 TaxID=3458415 RepID=UPI0040382B93